MVYEGRPTAYSPITTQREVDQADFDDAAEAQRWATERIRELGPGRHAAYVTCPEDPEGYIGMADENDGTVYWNRPAPGFVEE